MERDPIRGKTIRWSYEDGPTKGQSFEHEFFADGTVTYRMLDQKKPSPDGDTKQGKPAERPKYEVAKVTTDVWSVSYLAPSGWTLTTVLDFDEGTMVSFASNEKQLFVQRGSFEVLEPAKR